MEKIAPDLLLTLKTSLNALAGVNTSQAIPFLADLAYEAAISKTRTVTVAGTTFRSKQFDDLYVTLPGSSHTRVTPAGARFLVLMYEQDLLPMTQEKKKPKAIGKLLADFIESEQALIATTNKRQAPAVTSRTRKPPETPTYDPTTDIFQAFFASPRRTPSESRKAA